MSSQDKQLQERDYEPLLLLPNLQGGHFREHIPGNYSKFSQNLRDYYNAYRGKFGLKLYYWQFRFLFQPKERKIYDLNFMLHVEKDHDGKPDLPMEKLHYLLARRLYGREANFIKALDSLEWQMEHSKDIYLQKDHYVKAYKKKWLSNFTEDPNWRLLYHGIEILEIKPVMDKMHLKHNHRKSVYRKALAEDQ